MVNRSDRGQTPADYLIGISLLLVTIVGVFAFVPGIFQPFEDPGNPEDRAMADRVAGSIIENSTMLGKEQTVDLEDLKTSFDNLDDFRGGIPEWRQVNVTLWKASDITKWNGNRLKNGSKWHGDAAGGTSIRTITSHQDVCADGCQLVVRVWSR